MARGGVGTLDHICVCVCVRVCVCARTILLYEVYIMTHWHLIMISKGACKIIYTWQILPQLPTRLWKTKRGMNANTSISDYRHTGSHTNDRVDWTLVYKHDGTPGQSWQMFPGIRLSFTVCLAVLFISEDLLNHQRPFKTLRMLETFWERSVSIGQPWTTLFFA